MELCCGKLQHMVSYIAMCVTKCLWWVYITGKSPYEDVPIADMLQHLEEGHRLSFPNGCSDAW